MFSKDSRFDGVVTPRDKNKGTFIGASIMYTKKIAQKIYPIPETLPSEDKWQVLCIDNLNKNTQDKLKDKNITDHERYILNHKLNVLKEI